MSNQVVYKFSSNDSRTITIKGILVRENVLSVNAPPEYSAEFMAQAAQFRPEPCVAGIETTEASLTTYAQAHGYTLTKSINGEGYSTTLNTAPLAPPELSVNAATSNTNELTWDGVLATMEIWRSRSTNANYELLATPDAAVGYDDDATIVGETYYYKVRLLQSGKVGIFSNEVSVVTVA